MMIMRIVRTNTNATNTNTNTNTTNTTTNREIQMDNASPTIVVVFGQKNSSQSIMQLQIY